MPLRRDRTEVVFVIGKIVRLVREELQFVRPRVWLMNGTQRLVPYGVAGRLRRLLYRLWGLPVGSGTILYGPLDFGCYGDVFHHLQIGANCLLNGHIWIDTTANVRIGNHVTLGHHVMLVTANHDMSHPSFRGGTVRPGPITVSDGCWLAARVVVLPGVTIGEGAVVAAGAVVARDVPPHTLVGGVPARTLRQLKAANAGTTVCLPDCEPAAPA